MPRLESWPDSQQLLSADYQRQPIPEGRSKACFFIHKEKPSLKHGQRLKQTGRWATSAQKRINDPRQTVPSGKGAVQWV